MDSKAYTNSQSGDIESKNAKASLNNNNNTNSGKKSFSVAFIMSDSGSTSAKQMKTSHLSNNNHQHHQQHDGHSPLNNDENKAFKTSSNNNSLPKKRSDKLTSSGSTVTDSSILSTSSSISSSSTTTNNNNSNKTSNHQSESQRKAKKNKLEADDFSEDLNQSSKRFHSDGHQSYVGKIAKIFNNKQKNQPESANYSLSSQENENNQIENDSNLSNDYSKFLTAVNTSTPLNAQHNSSNGVSSSAISNNNNLPYIFHQMSQENQLSYLKAAAAAFNNPYLLNFQSQHSKDLAQLLLESNSYLKLPSQMGLLQTVANSYQPSSNLENQNQAHCASVPATATSHFLGQGSTPASTNPNQQINSSSFQLNMSQSSSLSTPNSSANSNSILQPLGIGVLNSHNINNINNTSSNQSVSESTTPDASPNPNESNQQHSSKSSLGANNSSPSILPHWPWIPPGALPDSSTINAARKC